MESGIYQILNLVNNKRYIGSSKNILKRFTEHKRKLRKQIHHSRILQNAWNKYNESSFTFEILEICSIDELLTKESFFFEKYKPEYNISLSPSAPMKGRKHSQETLLKFKNRPCKRGSEHYLFGKKQSREHSSKGALKRVGQKRSAETRKKMSETAKRLNRYQDLISTIEKRKRKIVDSLGNIFDSLIECSKFHNISVQTVCDILKGRHFRTRNGVVFKYV